ncbi:MAG TPA: glutamate formimidoyltransferase [Anaerolineales bacterium]|nr:glutamate formimidoyltransferase [Anaerolineales bacterium]
MPTPLVECIPNFSEGRRPAVIDSIRSAIAAVPGVLVLDLHSDADHNRSVITFAGPPGPVAEAAFAAIARAAELIDLDHHSGEHPRIGATDVVPFVPLADVSMDECIRLARDLGRRVGEELGIPVYLYEAAASQPERRNLETHRRGQYEGLRQSIAEDPDRQPDFGPRRLGKAGATVIGARVPLIAFNVYLDTSEVRMAKEVARAVRASSGGMPFVKALGLEVEGLAQVSMNLTDYTQTPLAAVVERVRQEAARRGAGIRKSELVGLIPQAALTGAAAHYLQLEGFRAEQILEVRLQAARQAASDEGLLERLSQATPSPGGGSAAAFAGAMAAALVGMVARLTVGKKKYAEVEPRMIAIADEADRLRVSLQSAVEDDARAFDKVMEATRLPKETEAQSALRRERIEQATHHAAEVPLRTAEVAAHILELAAEVARLGNVNALSDSASAALLAVACFQAASLNVRVNAQAVADREAARRWEDALTPAKARAAAAEASLHQALDSRGKLSLGTISRPERSEP